MAQIILPVTVLTVCYNHQSYLPSYIDSLRASQYPIAEIIIVDNASDDGSAAWLAQQPDVTLIANRENIGYSAALNQAIAAATTPLVCATGPDIVVADDWLAPLIAQYHTDPARIFAVASRSITLDGHEVLSAGGSLHFTGHLCVYEMFAAVGSCDPTAVQLVGAIDSTSVLFDREKYQLIGGCDPHFFVYHEEFDYCYRARMRDWTCYYHPGSLVRHGSGSAEYSVRSAGAYPRQRPFLHLRNRWLALLKNYSLATLIIITPMLVVLELANLFVLWRMGLHSSASAAARWIWAHRREIRAARAVIQPTRLRADRDLLSADPLTITPVVVSSSRAWAAKRLLDLALYLYWHVARQLLPTRI